MDVCDNISNYITLDSNCYDCANIMCSYNQASMEKNFVISIGAKFTHHANLRQFN